MNPDIKKITTEELLKYKIAFLEQYLNLKNNLDAVNAEIASREKPTEETKEEDK